MEESIDVSETNKPGLSLDEKDRKEIHNTIERRRRYNINDKIQELGTLLPGSIIGTSKVNKGLILSATVNYIRALERENEGLQKLKFFKEKMDSSIVEMENEIQYLKRQLHTLKVLRANDTQQQLSNRHEKCNCNYGHEYYSSFTHKEINSMCYCNECVCSQAAVSDPVSVAQCLELPTVSYQFIPNTVEIAGTSSMGPCNCVNCTMKFPDSSAAVVL